MSAPTPNAQSARSYSIASDGDLRDRVNLGLLGKANAFTAPITVVNYDEKVLENNASRTLVDTIAKNDASTMQFGGESNTIQGVYVRGLQLDARQFSINGLAGLYSYYHTPTAGVSSAQLIKVLQVPLSVWTLKVQQVLLSTSKPKKHPMKATEKSV